MKEAIVKRLLPTLIRKTQWLNYYKRPRQFILKQVILVLGSNRCKRCVGSINVKILYHWCCLLMSYFFYMVLCKKLTPSKSCEWVVLNMSIFGNRSQSQWLVGCQGLVFNEKSGRKRLVHMLKNNFPRTPRLIHPPYKPTHEPPDRNRSQLHPVEPLVFQFFTTSTRGLWYHRQVCGSVQMLGASLFSFFKRSGMEVGRSWSYCDWLWLVLIDCGGIYLQGRCEVMEMEMVHGLGHVSTKCLSPSSPFACL